MKPQQEDTDDGQALTCLSVSEIRRMHAALCRPAHPPEHHLHWSLRRRRHQAIARQCHYQRGRERDNELQLPFQKRWPSASYCRTGTHSMTTR